MQRQDRILRDSPAHDKDVRSRWNEYKWRLGHQNVIGRSSIPRIIYLERPGTLSVHAHRWLFYERTNFGQEEAVRGIGKEKGFIFWKTNKKKP